MNLELKQRIITSIFLIILLVLMFSYIYILIISLIIIGIITWIEFYSLISKIFRNKNLKDKILRFFFKSISLIFLFLLIMSVIIIEALRPDLKFFLFFSLLISVASDMGGLIFGKIFKGKN